jgi:uncharacterized glyoxalase superfamily protein PhnB
MTCNVSDSAIRIAVADSTPQAAHRGRTPSDLMRAPSRHQVRGSVPLQLDPRAVERPPLLVQRGSPDEIKRWFNGMKDGGSVRMELGPQFWSKLYGFVMDKFGVGWQFGLTE